MHVAETAIKRLRLDEVWWFPTPGNPLKHRPGAYEARLAAVQVLTQTNRAMRVSDIEARAHITYTIDLVKLLKAHCPNARLVWLMGSDGLENFHMWRDWKALANLVPIAVIARPGSMLSARNSHFARVFANARLPGQASHSLPGHATPAWTYIKAPLNRASSTAIRQR